MNSFLLVHGAYHGAWCWRDVIPLLTERGHRVTAIDLPAHGDDYTPTAHVSLAAYARAIADASEEPVVVVGHSMAGMAISAAAELAPERFRALVYLAAHVPRSGMSLADMRIAAPRYSFDEAVEISDDGGSSTLITDLASAYLFDGCSREMVDFAISRVRPEPLGPLTEPVELTARYASVPRNYIRCSRDRVIVPEYQRSMTAGWREGAVAEIDSAHSPFLACPGRLVDALLGLSFDSEQSEEGRQLRPRA